MSEFVKSREDIFANASFVVIEHQMQSQMRVIAGALFACIRMLSKDVRLVFQQSSAKLRWHDLDDIAAAESLQGTGAYAARKKAAVEVACFLLNITLPPTNRRKAKNKGQECLIKYTCPMTEVFVASTKRDDLADSLLHLLAFSIRQHIDALPKKAGKRKRSVAS